MQLDRTRIAIHERNLLETLDLALHVTRRFIGPIVTGSLLAIVPLALLNYVLVGWMAPRDLEETSAFRYFWNMTILVYLEAPLAAVFVVAYLGPAVFLDERPLEQIARDVLRNALPLALCQGLLRGVFLAWGLYVLTDRLAEPNGFIEGFLMIVIVLWATALRAFRPYINEIILLEQNPLSGKNPATITMGKRSAHLHSPYAGDLFIRWLGAATIGLVLVLLAIFTAVMTEGFLISDWPVHWSAESSELLWNLSWFRLEVLYPACLWTVVVFLSVVRFLSYLDLRIRHEGWEVELLMRAEGQRLAAQLD
jgi:hypothetical protein